MNRPVQWLALALFVACGLAPTRAHAADCAPVPAGLVGWWKLEGNGLDETTLHDGAAVGSGAFVPGEVGLGYSGGGANNAVVIPHDAGLNVVNFTADAWVRPDDIPCINMPVVWKGQPNGADVTTPFSIGIYGTCERPANQGEPFAIITDGTSEQELDAPASVVPGTWTHLAATADGTTFTLYVDGVAVNSVAQTIVLQTNARPLQLGGVAGPGALNAMIGVVDEVELHSVAASAAQIAAIYAAGAAGKCPLATPAQRASWGSVKATYR